MAGHAWAQPAQPILMSAFRLIGTDSGRVHRFSVAWYPICRIPDSSLQAQFLTFHSFVPVPAQATHMGALAAPPLRPYVPSDGADGPLVLPLIGIKWVNADGEGWLTPDQAAGDESGVPGVDLDQLLESMQVSSGLGPTLGWPTYWTLTSLLEAPSWPPAPPNVTACTQDMLLPFNTRPVCHGSSGMLQARLRRGAQGRPVNVHLMTRMAHAAAVSDDESKAAVLMQATAGKLANGENLRHMGEHGVLQQIRLQHPDYSYFSSRQSTIS